MMMVVRLWHKSASVKVTRWQRAGNEPQTWLTEAILSHGKAFGVGEGKNVWDGEIGAGTPLSAY